MALELYRGLKIERTRDVLSFPVPPSQAFCIQVRERLEDSAPIIDMFASIEEAREAIDEHIEENA